MLFISELLFVTLILTISGLGINLMEKSACQSSVLISSFELITKNVNNSGTPKKENYKIVCRRPLLFLKKGNNYQTSYGHLVKFNLNLRGNLQ